MKSKVGLGLLNTTILGVYLFSSLGLGFSIRENEQKKRESEQWGGMHWNQYTSSGPS